MAHAIVKLACLDSFVRFCKHSYLVVAFLCNCRLQDGALTAGHPNGSAEAAGAEEEAAGEGAPGDKAQHKKKKKQQQNGLQRKGEGEQLGEEEH